MGVFARDSELVPIGPNRFDQTALFGATAGWAALGLETESLATSVEHIVGTTSLSFAKVDAAPTTKIGGIYRGISWDLTGIGAKDKILAYYHMPGVTNIDYAFLRLGTDVSHLVEYQMADGAMDDGAWNAFEVTVDGYTTQTGNGIDWSAVTYIAVGFMFDLEAHALAALLWNSVAIEQAQVTRT